MKQSDILEAERHAMALQQRHTDLDWSVAVQSAAMSLGLNERELLDELCGDPMGDHHGKNK